MVFRIGGDEFVILLPDTSEIEATLLAKRAIEKISVPFDLGVGTAIPIRVEHWKCLRACRRRRAGTSSHLLRSRAL
ncbi:MAG: diguanylate cyclase [Mesorhizobium sp.]|nr:MAG: diguanylate cyclase [Mesorhizobium sp.]